VRKTRPESGVLLQDLNGDRFPDIVTAARLPDVRSGTVAAEHPDHRRDRRPQEGVDQCRLALSGAGAGMIYSAWIDGAPLWKLALGLAGFITVLAALLLVAGRHTPSTTGV